MSTDLKDRLHRAAATPRTPLDVDVVYRRGMRTRRVRVATLTVVVVAVIVGGLGGLQQLARPSAPPIGGLDVVGDPLADERISWREYRVAVSETADCLEQGGVDRTYRFDDETGVFTFTAERTATFRNCREAHLAFVEDAWVAMLTDGSDGFSWKAYRDAYRDYADCVEEHGLQASRDFDLALGDWGRRLCRENRLRGA